MANFVISKGYKVGSAETAANFKFGRCVKLATADTTGATVTGATATTDTVLGVLTETLDAAKILTGKSTVTVAVVGIARCEASAAITVGAMVNTTTVGKIATAGAAGTKAVGMALQSATADGDLIDVLLTPGATV